MGLRIRLAGLFVLILIATACNSNKIDLSYESTGDDLYDRFAELILSQVDLPDSRGNYSNPDGNMKQEFIDFSKVNSWEEEFQNDHRYWELRACVAEMEDLYDIFSGSEQQPTDLELVERLAGFNTPSTYAAIPIFQLAKQEQQIALDLLDKAIACDPVNSHFYYAKALLNLDHTTQLLPISVFEKANIQTKHEYILSFPVNTAFDQLGKCRKPGNQVAAVIISGFSYGGNELDRALAWGFVNRVIREHHQLTAEELDQLLLAVYFDNTTKPADSLRAMRCGVLLKALLETVNEQPASFSPTQREHAKQLLIILDEYTEAFSNYFLGNNNEETADDAPQLSAIEEWLEGYSTIDADQEFVTQNLKLLTTFEQPQFSVISTPTP